MANKPRIDIGVSVDYKGALEQMRSDFKKELTEISNQSKKTKFDADIKKQLTELKTSVGETFDYFEKKFEDINSQKIGTENFKKLEEEVNKKLESMRTKISNFVTDVNEKMDLLGGGNAASGLLRTYDDLTQRLLTTYKHVESIHGLVSSLPSSGGGVSSKTIANYKETLDIIKNLENEVEKLYNPKTFKGKDKSGFIEDFETQRDALVALYKEYQDIKKQIDEIPIDDRVFSNENFANLDNQLAQIQVKRRLAAQTIKAMNSEMEQMGLQGVVNPKIKESLKKVLESTYGEIQEFEERAKKLPTTLGTIMEDVSHFVVKDGAIQVPLKIDEISSSELEDKVKNIVSGIQKQIDSKPVIAKVKLVLDGSSSKGYEKNEEIDKHQAEGQDEPALDISKTIQNTYRKAAREAKQIVKTEIKKIQEEFENVPVKIKPDTDAFEKEVSAMVNGTLEKIAKESSGINVNQELEKLIGNLKEVSSSLSGNENFKFGLDEASIARITAAIKDMADMIQRAFGVASNEDIAAQWSTIESKFKGVAGEEGKLLKGNKEHKVAIQELAVEYKKYLDMGGKNDLSTLTAHKQTVKNITAEYENLGKAAQEAAQKQEKVSKKPVSTKVSSEEAEAVKGVTKQNKNLETQAGKTGTALDNEGKKAQSAAEKFRKLAKEKGAAVYANRELAKAAKETADALEREAKAKKSGAGKTNKSAVDEGTYESNALTWQKNIKRSLLDGGSYEEVYGGQLSRLESGVVKYTASVRDSEGAWKKLTATISSSGDIQSTKLQDLTEKQVLKIEKEKEAVAKMLEQMDDESAEPMRLNRDELERYANDVKSILKGLEKSEKATYTVNLGSDGKLSVTRKEISKTGAEVKSFTAVIENVEDVFNNTSEGMVVSARKLKEALKSAFDNGNISKSTKDLAASAREAFDVFKEKAVRDGNFSAIESDLENLRQQIANIKTSKDLVKFNQDLKDLGVTLKNVGKDNKLGEIIGGDRTFKDINEVRANIDSLFASMGKVNEKSIRVTGTNKLTAEVKAANGEIRKMNVNLDSKGFVRYVDAGIVQFGRLRAAAEGVFKGIKDMVRIYLSPSDFIRYFRQGFDAVREIDTAMTELRKVSDASPSDITAYFDDAVESAKELGSSVNEMIGATADWQRMGYNLPDSRELGEVAILYKNVGDGIDVDTANESLTSTMQGFQLQAKDAMSVIDAFNEVSNNYAISSAGIGEALKRSAAAFNAANTDLNQAIALITAGNEIVQSPEKVGKHYANLYSNVLIIKVAISVKSQRWSRPSKDLIIIHF